MKKWHPDRWTKDHFGSGEAKRRFQQIQEAYSGTVLFRPSVWCFSVVVVVVWGWRFFFFWKHVVLSDRRKRSLYDVGLYDTEEDEVCISFAVWMATWGSIDRLICFLFLIKGYFDFAGEMISLMSQTRREVKLFSLVTLTSLLCMLSVFAHKLMLLVIVACRKSNTVWKSWKQWSMIWSMNSSQNRCSRTSRWIWSLTWTNR